MAAVKFYSARRRHVITQDDNEIVGRPAVTFAKGTALHMSGNYNKGLNPWIALPLTVQKDVLQKEKDWQDCCFFFFSGHFNCGVKKR